MIQSFNEYGFPYLHFFKSVEVLNLTIIYVGDFNHNSYHCSIAIGKAEQIYIFFLKMPTVEMNSDSNFQCRYYVLGPWIMMDIEKADQSMTS